jgi:hypothetical protein
MKILNFKNFELSINEAEQIDETITLTSQIMSTFFDIYSFILPSAEGYSGIIKDIESMVDGDANDKETAMEAIKGSILGAVSEDAKKAEFYKDTETAFSLLIGSYKKMIAQFEKDKDKEDLKKVAGEVGKSAVRFIDSLKASKKSVPESKESIEYTPNDINEAIRNKKERKEILSLIVSTKGNIDYKMEEPGTSLKPTLTKLSSELDNIAKKVEDDKYWKDIKRKERNTELEEITNRVTQIPMEISAEKDKLFKSMDSNKDSIAELKKAMDSIKKATEAKEKFTAEKINAETEKKEEPEDKKEDKKDDKEFSDIDPKDPDNMKKVGKNRESIKAMQVATNKILGEVEGYKKIDEDGLYGKNTTEAFKKAQDLLNKLGAGLNTEGKLSASVQKAFTNFVEKKEEISKLITK